MYSNAATAPGRARVVGRLLKDWTMWRECISTAPNAELTGRRRMDGLAVRPMMNQGGRTAKLASRWRSG